MISQMSSNIILFIILTSMFCHVVDDFYLQGVLVSMKQKQWWKDNSPDTLYEDDYITALLIHAFSWTFMIHVPWFVGWLHFSAPNEIIVYIVFALNLIIHAMVDDLKANKKMINLQTDQCIHFIQVLATGIIYGLMR